MVTDSLHELLQVERQRLAGELHDDTIQCMIATGYQLELALGTDVSETTRASIERAKTTLREATERTRRLMFETAPAILVTQGCAPVVLSVLTAAAADLNCSIETDLSSIRFNASEESLVYRVFREAVHNIHKHSHATRVAATLVIEPRHGALWVQGFVSDNGRGFDVEAAMRKATTTSHPHLGLQHMLHRIEMAGGNRQLHSAPGLGTSLHFGLPTIAPKEAARKAA